MFAKRTFLLLTMIFFTVTVFAQQRMQDVVYLKNGSIIRGQVMEMTPEKGIKVETADHSLFVFSLSEIIKVVKETISTETEALHSGDVKKEFKNGYQAFIELGFSGDISGSGGNRVKLNLINGYRINSHLYTGIGTGVRYTTEGGVPLIPIFADVRYLILRKKTTPYLSLDLGYSFYADNDFTDDGFFLAPTIGTSFRLAPKTSLNIGLGFEFQQIQLLGVHEASNGVSLNFGLSF